jgi:hypothetical protein
MPIVSVNLTDNAWTYYKMWRDHGRSASYKVSMAIERLWNQEEEVNALQPGDKRSSVYGMRTWTGNDWVLDEPLEGEEQ